MKFNKIYISCAAEANSKINFVLPRFTINHPFLLASKYMKARLQAQFDYQFISNMMWTIRNMKINLLTIWDSERR